MLEKFALFRIARCSAPAFNRRSSARNSSFLVANKQVPFLAANPSSWPVILLDRENSETNIPP
jgi:hypothetical protein